MNSFATLSSRTIHYALIVLLLFTTGFVLAPRSAQAATAAGTMISNQASATYTDATLTARTATSNTVVTVVQQVASLTLTADGAKTVVAGGQVSYPHTLTNTGNGADTFALTNTNSGDFAMASVLFYADANGDGVADDAIPITASGSLAADEVFKFVAVATTPGTAAAGSTNALMLTATSNFDGGVAASNTDTTTVSGRAIVNVTKTMDNLSGPSPSGPHTITLSYSNAGMAAASNVTLLDTLPAGMSYVAGSARWSTSGAAVLSDADNTDNQGGMVYDFGVSQPNRVTAVIASLAGGAAGSLSFQVSVNAGLPAGASTATANTGQWNYNDGVSDIATTDTNTAQFIVTTVRSLALIADQSGTVVAGGSVVYQHTLTNTGNVLEGDGLLSQATLATADSAAGFASVVHWDKNNDGLLDADDPVVTSLAQLVGGSNGASTAAGLDAGESATLFVKVSAPAATPDGAVDTTTLSVASSGLVNNVTAPATVAVTDTTTASALGQIALVKAQALDANCDGVADTAFGTGDITTGAIPGACLRYQITATNTGGSNADAVVVTDATPANTAYHGTVAAATTLGTVTAPANGATGTVRADVGTLAPAQAAVVTFGVRINP